MVCPPVPLCSRTAGVNAPLTRARDGEADTAGSWVSGVNEVGVEISLAARLDPWVAAIDGDPGGSGDRVK